VDMEIMKTLASRSCLACAVGSLVIGAAPAAFAGDVVLHKVPALTVEQTPAYPENLARHHLGATIQALGSESVGPEAKLLSGDPVAAYQLPLGTTTLLVSLPKIANIEAISLASAGAKGNVSVATSNAKLPADSPQWHNVAERDLTSEPLDAKIGPAEAKYVRLTFNVTEPGSITGLGVYPTAQLSDFTATRKSGADDASGMSMGLVSYTVTDIHAKARALYVSSGSDLKQAHNVIDDQTRTSYTFANDDAAPTTVIDLGKPGAVRRLSAVYTARPGTMSFYVMSKLPAGQAADATQSGSDTMTINDAAFDAMTPVGTFSDDGTNGNASVEFPETTGRYVMVRWNPAAQQDGTFALMEVAALSGGNNKLLAVNSAEMGGGRTTDGKTVLDGKTMIESKDMPGEGPYEEPPPGEGPPPTLPQPPPFTFVPVLLPTSR
jgi:hypothetical protein